MKPTSRNATYALILGALLSIGPDALAQQFDGRGSSGGGGGGARSSGGGGSVGGGGGGARSSGGGGGSVGGGGGGARSSGGGGSVGGGARSSGGGGSVGGGGGGGAVRSSGGGGGGSVRSSSPQSSGGGSVRSSSAPTTRSSGGQNSSSRATAPTTRSSSNPSNSGASSSGGSTRSSNSPSSRSSNSNGTNNSPALQPSSDDRGGNSVRYTRPPGSSAGAAPSDRAGAPNYGPDGRTPLRQPPSAGNDSGGSDASSPPIIEAAPRRVPFPRLSTPAANSGATTRPGSNTPTARSTESAVTGPSARLRSGTSTPRTRASSSSTNSNPAPITPARTVDRDKILERYNRPSGSTERPGAPSTQRTPSTRTNTSTPAAGDRGSESGATTPKTARETAHDRNRYRLDHADEIKAKRDALRTQQAARDAAATVKNNRDDFRDSQSVSLDKRRAAIAAEKTQRLRTTGITDPDVATKINKQGHAYASGSGWCLQVGLSIGFGSCSSFGWCGYYSNCYWPWWSSCNSNYWGYNSYYWNGCGTYPWNWYCHPFSLCYGYAYNCWPYDIGYWYPSCYTGYYYSPPVYYSTIIEDQYYTDEQNYVEEQPAEEPAQNGESVEYGTGSRAQAPDAQPTQKTNPELDQLFGQGGLDTAARASSQYLSLGDQSFRERRFSDAVHFYAKAVEFRPNEGVLYLVLSDALFATGDYHYGAFALRRAFELDATLASGDIDKRSFYSDPSEFEAQIQTLERFVADRPTDADARLLLAANYLFSGRANLTIDLLESGASASVRNEAAGKLILDAAKRVIASKK